MPVFISMASDQPLSPAERAVMVGWHRPDTATAVCVGVCTRSRGCVRVGVLACVRGVFALYDNI